MRYYSMFGLLLLAACEGGAQNGAASAPTITAETVSATREAPVEDQLLTCVREEGTFKSTYRLAIINGAMKDYFSSSNAAQDFCLFGQQECAFGWQDGKAVETSLKPTYARVTKVYDVDARSMELFVDAVEGEDKDDYAKVSCESTPLPDGVTVS